MRFVYVVPEADCDLAIRAATNNQGLGYYSNSADEIQPALNKLGFNGFFAERNYMEVHPAYKQIIPIFMLIQREVGNKSFILYQRRPKHTEQRLAGLYTPVFGGHIDPIDYGEGLDGSNQLSYKTHDDFLIPWIISNGLFREFEEETNLQSIPYPISFNGFLYDPKDAVGRVHLGLLFSIYVTIDEELKDKILSSSEIHSLVEVDFKDIPELLKSNEYPLEGWARIVLNKFIKKA